MPNPLLRRRKVYTMLLYERERERDSRCNFSLMARVLVATWEAFHPQACFIDCSCHLFSSLATTAIFRRLLGDGSKYKAQERSAHLVDIITCHPVFIRVVFLTCVFIFDFSGLMFWSSMFHWLLLPIFSWSWHRKAAVCNRTLFHLSSIARSGRDISTVTWGGFEVQGRRNGT